MVIPSAGARVGSPLLHHHRAAAVRDRLSKRQLMDLSAVLELWLDENNNNLYPTREQKERIAIDTSMSYNQVNRWFANRRRKNQTHSTSGHGSDVRTTPSNTPGLDRESSCSVDNINNSGMSTPPLTIRPASGHHHLPVWDNNHNTTTMVNNNNAGECSSLKLVNNGVQQQQQQQQQQQTTPPMLYEQYRQYLALLTAMNTTATTLPQHPFAPLNVKATNPAETTTSPQQQQQQQPVFNQNPSVIPTQQQQQSPSVVNLSLIDSILNSAMDVKHQQKLAGSCGIAQTLPTAAKKQRLALIDADNLTEQETLAVAALTDLANGLF